jgi:fermentation-respiration switch protein FrsA (DUF1100 family)
MAAPAPAFSRRLALVMIVTVVLAGCGSPTHHRVATVTVPPASPPPPGTDVATTTVAAPATAPPTTLRRVAPPTSPARPTGVGTVSLNVVDPSRPTVQYGRTISSVRRLSTIVRYPAVGPTGAVEQPGAPPASGRWPLVVFAHGYDVTPATYAHLLHAWAAAGFVVAAPTFPLEAAGGPLDENDLGNEPRDIGVVISAVLSQTTGPLAGHVDGARIAVAGHSDGAEAALAVGYLAAPTGDRRIGPVVSMSAQGILGGPVRDPRHPLLVVQGTQDTINPPSRGDAVYAAAGAPRFELHLLGGGHLPPVAEDTPWRPIVEQVTIDFLHRYLGGGIAASVVDTDGTRVGLATVTSDP